MSERPKRKSKDTKHFWRACRYLFPYRGMIAISISAAFLVGLTVAGGLGAMLPIIRVLIVGDTVQGWVYRQTDQPRMGIRLSQDDPRAVQVAGIDAKGPADNAGLKIGDKIEDVVNPAGISTTPFAGNEDLHASELLRRIAWTDGDLNITVNGKDYVLQLKPQHWYTPISLKAVEALPVRPVPAVAAVFAILALISIVGQVARFFQEYLSDKAGILAVNDIRRQLYDRVLHVPLQFFGTQGASDVTSRLVSDSANLQDGFKQVLGQTIQEPIKAAMAMGLALYLNWELTVLIIVFAPVMAVIVKKFGKKMRRASRAALQNSSAMLGQIEGTLIGIRVVKGASAERYERRRYMSVMGKLILEQMKMSRIDAFSAPVLETAIMLMAGVIVLVATRMVVSQSLAQEDFIGIMMSLAVIGESLRRTSKATNALQKSNAAAQRIFEALDMPVERPRVGRPKARPLPPLQSQIEFRDITFSYANSNSPALAGVDLTVPRGQSVAIVGRNGSGKTTLLALLPRFFDPQGGQILIDGKDTRAVTLPSLRKQISIVTQESIIFPGTIAQNIAYASPNPNDPATRKQIEEAARRAFAHEFILEKPQGYDTVLGEMGGQLSGGQRQRICIARAIFRQAPILILDEATSQVDADSEHLIQQAIEQLMHQRTTFVIAHRFSTIISADTIVVMERGRVVGQGKHEELMRTCPTYLQLYERQLIGSSEREMAK